MGTLGELLLTKVEDRVRAEQKKWEVRKVGRNSWSAVSPSGEIISFRADDESMAQSFIKKKIMKDKYGSTFSRERLDTDQASV